MPKTMNTIGLITFIMALLINSSLGFASPKTYTYPAFRLPKNELLSRVVFNQKSEKITNDDVTTISKMLTRELNKNLSIAKSSTPGCYDNRANKYITALAVAGKYSECIERAQLCSGSLPQLFQGATCARQTYNYAAADKIFSLALNRFSPSADRNALVLAYAIHLLTRGEDQKAFNTLTQNQGWSERNKIMWIAVIRQFFNANAGKEVATDLVMSFMQSQLSKTTGLELKMIRNIWLMMAYDNDLHGTIIKNLLQWGPELDDPFSWASLAYNSAFTALNKDFKKAKEIYDTYDPFTNPFSNSTLNLSPPLFPGEKNPLNYSEIKNSICVNSMDEASAKKLEILKRNLREGNSSSESALSKTEELLSKNLGNVDLLVIKAYLLNKLGKNSESIQTYWKAHRLCPYNGRADWGLRLVFRDLDIVNIPDFAKNMKRIDQELSERSIPDQSVFEKYFYNWNILSTETEKKNIFYSLRIWLPYLKMLTENGLRSYFKLPFELLSEGPGLESYADLRVQYDHDHRLWDDVRGLGGSTVVSDLVESQQSHHGIYNLLAHEIAHQFHQYLDANSLRLSNCIDRLYDEAKKNGSFPELYAGQNVQEYFAQGVTYYLVPEDSPIYFGTNRSWYKQNDPKLFEFIQSIDKARGDLGAITCPR